MPSLASASTACINMHSLCHHLCTPPVHRPLPFNLHFQHFRRKFTISSLFFSPQVPPPPLGPPTCPTDLVLYSSSVRLASLSPTTDTPQSSITHDALTAPSLTFFHCLVPFFRPNECHYPFFRHGF
ncbi:hypothetical protein CGRA01v4_13395 [Colletotrichum graminicola]|nr:hypothetical protein CGRA01v4_13395 [Colletotrichum graminicola]